MVMDRQIGQILEVDEMQVILVHHSAVRVTTDVRTEQIKGEKVKLRSEGLSWQEIDGELVILDLKSSVYLSTNKSGAFLAKALTDERTADELIDALVDEYGIARERAASDANAFVGELMRKGLLD